MEYRRRFVFHGHAAAFGGHLIRPKDIVLEAQGASALLPSGGRSVARLARASFDGFFEVESATTLAEGKFDDPAQFLALTHRRVEEQTLTAVTYVNAEVQGLAVGREPRLTIRRLRAALHARSPLGSGEPSVRVDPGVAVEGIAVDGRTLVVELDPNTFGRLDTRSKLLTAADDAAFVQQSGNLLFMKTPIDGHPAPPPGGRIIQTPNGYIVGTIVKSIRWSGEPFPGSSIDHNLVVIPGLGRLFFGELIVGHDSRRLTMLRMELGSDTGGSASAADVQDNGMWSP